MNFDEIIFGNAVLRH